MKKKIVIKSCDCCAFVRNLESSEAPYCCIRAAMILPELLDYKITNPKRIPRWCPLPDDEVKSCQ